MDANRKWYRSLRHDFMAWLDDLDLTMAQLHDDYYPTPGKKGINRINNNLMFHPNKPVYKDHFGAGLDKAPQTADFYIEIGLKNCLLAGGFWRPDPKTLRSIREGIDYDGEVLQEILDKPSFQKIFGNLYEDEKLTNAPKGFSNDHPHIDLLKNKTFAVVHEMSQKEVLQPNFKEKIVKVYQEMLPFRQYLNRTVTV
jgi:TIGR02453 family protein